MMTGCSGHLKAISLLSYSTGGKTRDTMRILYPSTVSLVIVFTCTPMEDAEVGWGNPQFIPHSSLSYNRTTNIEYLHDDCLRLRVKTVAIYSTPLLLKTPAWQDPLTASQSLYV